MLDGQEGSSTSEPNVTKIYRYVFMNINFAKDKVDFSSVKQVCNINIFILETVLIFLCLNNSQGNNPFSKNYYKCYRARIPQVIMQQTAFLRKQSVSESWEFVLFSVLICAGVHTEAIWTVELKRTLFLLKFYLNAALLP